MAIKPILFNTEMVRAILDGRKVCTRRVIKHNVGAILNSPYHMEHPEVEDAWLIKKLCRPPYEPGDILYVRETWCGLPVNEAGHFRGHPIYYYKADGDLRPEGWRGAWHPSIHMPKEAARIWLKVTDVRVERLQDMTDDDAEAEGCFDYSSTALGFFDVWDSTIKKSDRDRYGWTANPWVWVIQFERCGKPEEVRR
nr:MAG TPA: hypothetical protein [Caudoviricetes sp.]